MQMPGATTSTDVFLDLGDHLLARVEADPDTKGMGEGLSGVQDTLRQRKTAREAAETALEATHVVQDRADEALDRSVIDLSLVLLRQVKNRREDERYKAIFPDAPSTITSAPLSTEVARVQALEARLAGSGDALLAAEFKGRLEDGRKAVDEAREAVESQLGAVRASFGLEKQAQLAWRRQYRKTYGRLLDLFPLDLDRVESYFRAPRRERRPEEEAAGPATVTTAAPAAAVTATAAGVS